MIRQSTHDDFEAIYLIINQAAEAYRGVIPEDRWKVPYMPRHELRHEIACGVRFWCYEEEGEVMGVSGLQDVLDVSLIRHMYVSPERQRRGIGGKLLKALRKMAARPILIGTWADAIWAVRFYENHGFRLVSPSEKSRLLNKYWSVPPRQIDTSVVLADQKWFGEV